MNDYNDLLQTAIDGVLSEEDALQFIIENGADEELLQKLGYNNAIKGSKLIKANIVDYVLRKCGRNQALLMGVLALLISSGQLFGYTVKKNDTLWAISQRAGCSLEEIYDLNPGLKHKKYIKQGMNIVLPNEVKSERTDLNSDKFYIVQSGDTLSGIAAMYGIKLNELLRLNPQINIKKPIKIGQKIYIGDYKKVPPIYRNNQHEKLDIDAAVKALREVESLNGTLTKPGDDGKAIGEFQLWEIFVKDYHKLGGKKEYKCHVINGVAQPDDVRWDAKKSEQMVRFVLKKRGYRNMQEIIRGYSEYNGRNNVKYPGWNGGVSVDKLNQYVEAYKNYCN